MAAAAGDAATAPATKVHLNADEPDDAFPMYAVTAPPPKAPGTIRLWVDGCFDMLHFGHTNAIRQARALGHELFVGVHSDAEIERHKGPPIMQEDERYEAVRQCKWATFVVENYPYCTRLKDMRRWEIDFVVHGDDVSVSADGHNSYQEIIDAGLFKVVKRTDGISTTDLVGRMLLCTKGHHSPGEDVGPSVAASHSGPQSPNLRYLTTSRKIVQFSNNRAPEPGNLVIYVDGSFDLFHIGHMRLLELAKTKGIALMHELQAKQGKPVKEYTGAFLVVGIHEDSVVNSVKGLNYPIMNLNERVLGVLSCKWADDVVMGVPYKVSDELIRSLGVELVVAGRTRDVAVEAVDPYEVPKAANIFAEVDSACSITTEVLIQRIVDQHERFVARQRSKAIKDKASQQAKPECYQNVKEVA